jgi:hypothetical protein
MVENFREFGIEKSMKDSKTKVFSRHSAIGLSHAGEEDEILSVKEETTLIKKLEEEMAKALEEALRKNVKSA